MLLVGESELGICWQQEDWPSVWTQPPFATNAIRSPRSTTRPVKQSQEKGGFEMLHESMDHPTAGANDGERFNSEACGWFEI